MLAVRAERTDAPLTATTALPVAPEQLAQRPRSKRLCDIAISTILLILALPVLALVLIGSAIAFRAWPLFVQDRVGADGRRLRFVKVRSLPPATNAYADKYALAEVPIPLFGRIIRSLHVDEIPQLVLVLMGHMSLVGPRPEMPTLHAALPADVAEARTSVRPGCTGLWQVSNTSDGLIAEAPEFDLLYVRESCLRLDAWILLQTVRKIVQGGRGSVTMDSIPAWALRTRTTVVPVDDVVTVIDLRDHRPQDAPLTYELPKELARAD